MKKKKKKENEKWKKNVTIDKTNDYNNVGVTGWEKGKTSIIMMTMIITIK